MIRTTEVKATGLVIVITFVLYDLREFNEIKAVNKFET